MAGEWQETSLADVAVDVSYGYTESATTDQVGPKFLRITDIQGGVVDWSHVPYCPITPEEHRKYKLTPGDIVVARTGNSTGENYLYWGDEDAVFASYLIRFRLDRSRVSPRFVWYNMRTSRWWGFINSSKTGSAQAGANARVLGRFPLTLPPLGQQDAIACILGALDDKIALNRMMNRTLEATARAIFKSWFVDFDPVRAKAAGQQPSGLKPEISALFPDAFEESEQGEIPTGWRISPIGDMVRVLGGGTPSTKEPAYWEGGTHPFCTPKDMSSLTEAVLLGTERHLTDEGLAKVSSGQLPVGTVLLSSRAPIGYLAVAETPVSVNQGIIAMVCDGELPNLYVLHWTRASMDRVLANANGSTFMEISKRNFRPITAVIPPQPVLRYFMQIVEPMHQRVVSSLRQIQHLADLRDSLLPRLISGELVVEEAERIARRAI